MLHLRQTLRSSVSSFMGSEWFKVVESPSPNQSKRWWVPQTTPGSLPMAESAASVTLDSSKDENIKLPYRNSTAYFSARGQAYEVARTSSYGDSALFKDSYIRHETLLPDEWFKNFYVGAGVELQVGYSMRAQQQLDNNAAGWVFSIDTKDFLTSAANFVADWKPVDEWGRVATLHISGFLRGLKGNKLQLAVRFFQKSVPDIGEQISISLSLSVVLIYRWLNVQAMAGEHDDSEEESYELLALPSCDQDS